jgi:O-antigen ligase
MQWVFRSGARKLNFTSTFLNPNLYATITEMIILLGIYQLLSAKPGKRRGPVAVILLNLCSLYLGNCRTAFIALGIAVMVMLVLNRRFKTFALFLGAFAIIAATANMLPQILPKFSSTGSDLAKRISIWKTALRGIWEQPVFGQGGGAYLHVFPRFSGTSAVHTHNIILEILLDFGLFGTTLLGLYLKEQVKSLASLFGTPEGRRDLSLVAAILTAVVLHGLTDVTFFSVQTSLLLVMCLSVADTRSVRTEFCPAGQPAAAWLEPARKVAVNARTADDKQR